MAWKIIIDTDIGEDIDDILVTAFALRSPEFEVLAVTVADCDVRARSRIARKLLSVVGRPDIPVGRGYARCMPAGDLEGKPGDGMSQTDLAPDETGLPEESPLPADRLIATLAEEHPGEVTVTTIGMMSNVAQALVRYPEATAKLKQIVTNGGNFGPDIETAIGWNLRYDPVAAALVARGPVPWVLLPENAMRTATLRAEDVDRLRADDGPLPQLLARAVDLWHANKRDAGPNPHLSDLNTLAWLLGGWMEDEPGRAVLTVPPRGQKPGLEVEPAADGPHRLGRPATQEKGAALRELFLDRILAAS
jgi:purine nucleosidase